MAAPVANVLLGLWLFVSTFALHRPPIQLGFTAACGIATAVSAVLSIYTRAARYATLAIAILLFFVSVTAGGSRATVWHNVVIAVGIVLASGLGDHHQPAGRGRTLAEA